MRPDFLDANGMITDAWKERYQFLVRDKKSGKVIHYYCPTPKQLDFHESMVPNCIIEGSRGTGKSLCIRNDAHMRALACPGYCYLIVRRTMPELKKSHLKFISAEMKAMGGYFHKTDNIAYYKNGSMGFFSHCETEDDMMKLLSSEYDVIYFDEISTFTWVMITKIGSCVRVAEGSGRMGLVRGGTNPIGVGAAEVRRYYITKDMTAEEDPEYHPADYEAIHTTLEDNPHIDRIQYIKRLSNLPEHIRRAWLDGEWIVEGAYFHDYKPQRKVRPEDTILLQTFQINDLIDWHCINEYPVIASRTEVRTLADPFEWIQVYRAFDYGFSPDPSCCLWIAMLPNGRAIVFKEQTWRATAARVIAEDIKRASQGFHIVDTYADPSIFFNQGATEYNSIGDIIENNGVPLTESLNDRAAAGYAIHEYLNTILPDGRPKLQIYAPGCPQLCRTLPEMRTDKLHPEKIANGNDHWVIALAYFCMGDVSVSREHKTSSLPRWMRPKRGTRRVLGSESVRASGRTLAGY